MNQPIVKKYDIKEIRPELLVSFFDVIIYMTNLGWELELEAPARLKFSVTNDVMGFVKFKKVKEWNNRPIWATACEFGYRIDSPEDIDILLATRHAAELCLQVYETFGAVIPSSADGNGVIRPCPIANKEEYTSETYPEAQARLSDLRKVEVAYKPSVDSVYVRPLKAVITKDDVGVLKSKVNKLLRVFKGEIALSKY